MTRRCARTLAAAMAAAALTAPGAHAGTDTLVFEPDADTYADASSPSTGFGASTSLWVDAAPRREAFLRFWAPDVAGRRVTGVRLRLVQRDASPAGGRVFGMSAAGWNESLTWSGRPALDGSLLAAFGAVGPGAAYTATLDPAVVAGPVVALGMDSTSSDGSRWGASEGSAPPRLEVDVESPEGLVADGLGLVAASKAGSSDPTSFASGRRLALTAGGRLLAVHGRHADGVRLAWRDPSGGWRSATTGASSSGRVLGGTGTGDWSTSIVAGDDGTGVRRAWVVMAGPNSSSGRSLHLRRLTELDAATGPRVGSLVTLDAPAGGAYRADVALERRPDGTVRGVVVWTRRVADVVFELVAGSFDPRASAPAIAGVTTLVRGSSAARFGTVVAAPAGLRVLARGDGGALTVFARGADGWAKAATGPAIDVRSAPSAVALPGGDVLVAVERDLAARTTDVLRVSSSGDAVATELTAPGLAEPTLAAHGGRAVLVGVDAATGHLVSRERAADSTWTAEARTEVGPEGRARLKQPNALRESDGRLRVLAEGPDGTHSRSSVVAFQRPF